MYLVYVLGYSLIGGLLTAIDDEWKSKTPDAITLNLTQNLKSFWTSKAKHEFRVHFVIGVIQYVRSS